MARSVIELASLNGSNDVRADGIEAFNFSGDSVSAAGDVNGDGLDDLIIGAPGAGAAGQSYVVFGSKSGFVASLDLTALDGTDGFALNGIVDDAAGDSVSDAGDVNGDGIDDLVIGAPNGNGFYVVTTYVVFGSSATFAASFELSTLDGSNGFALRGIDDYDLSGYSVSGAGDVNGDGIDDVIVGAPAADAQGLGYNEGQAYVVFGSTARLPGALELSTLDGTNGFALNGVSPGEDVGRSVSGAGDVNGDGHDDLIVGSPTSDRGYVVFGSKSGFGASLDLDSLDGGNGFAFDAVVGGLNSVSAAGDMNGDGIDDVIVGVPEAGPNGKSEAGRSYVVFGSPSGFPASLRLPALDGSTGFAIGGIAPGDNSGRSVSVATDFADPERRNLWHAAEAVGGEVGFVLGVWNPRISWTRAPRSTLACVVAGGLLA